MEEKVGLIKGVECKFVKTDIEIIDSLVARTGMGAEMIRVMMRYNMFTINQFSDLTGLSVSHILNKTRPSVIDGVVGTELDFCFPFQDQGNPGPKFIVRNDKSEKYIKL
jgi:hypothetical protein